MIGGTFLPFLNAKMCERELATSYLTTSEVWFLPLFTQGFNGWKPRQISEASHCSQNVPCIDGVITIIITADLSRNGGSLGAPI